MPYKSLPRLVVSGTGSGAGKTAVTCGVIRGLHNAGYSVQPFKAGPDYIDPGYLAAAAGRPAHNLDVWLMGRRGVVNSLAANSASDMSVIEGVMGFYDGYDGAKNLASTHHIASLTKSPTILVVDAAGAGRSVAATVLGFCRFAKRSNIAGVILNRVGSDRHRRMCSEALQNIGVKVLGAVPKGTVRLQSRHLGLVPVMEDSGGRARQDVLQMAGAVSECLDIDRIAEVARSAPPIREAERPKGREPGVSIGVALDASFNFYYADNLERLKRGGARLEFFSPESAAKMPDIDGLYIGGGFPEVRGAALERNGPLRDQIRDMIQDGCPAYAECGGLMYLARTLRSGGQAYRMVGALEGDSAMTGSVTLNYTDGTMEGGPLYNGSVEFRGHEFHYSAMEAPQDARFAQRLRRGRGIAGGQDGMLEYGAMASYGHLYLSERMARGLVRRCSIYSRR